MLRSVTAEISGWGNHSRQTSEIYRPESATETEQLLTYDRISSLLARGLGRSYGDSAVNGDGATVLLTHLNRFLSFDPETGVLECEAGVSLAHILQTFLPRGFFLPVTPGTKHVTVGGAVANDVHGKNHHRDGAFSNCIISFRLMLASGEILTCSRESHPYLFWATVGGIGLTGFILTVRLRLVRIHSALFSVKYLRARNLDEALEMFTTTEKEYQYSVAWIDCLKGGRSLGRSVLMLGNPAPDPAPETLKPSRNPFLRIPFYLPAGTLNSATIGAFNEVYFRRHGSGQRLVHLESFFYPLDAILDWNRMYGRSGFVQYQVVLPPETSLRGMTRILEMLSAARASSFLAVLKSLGPEGQGLLSFPKRGFTLALDLPFRGPEVEALLNRLDGVVLENGGRVYLAKDSVLKRDVFREMYPRLGQFQEIKSHVDPNHLFSSSMARRLGIMEA